MSRAIRLAVPNDLPLLSGIERAAATIFPPGSIPDSIRNDAVPMPLLAESMEAGNLFVAVDAEDQPVGYLLLRVFEGLAIVAQVDVHPTHCRQGIGTALMHKAAMRARELGHNALHLTTFTHVPWNAPFYAKLGYVVPAYESLPPAIRLFLQAERMAGLENRTAMRLGL